MEIKFERKCSICRKAFKASHGDICAECWPVFQENSLEWKEFFKWFPWVRENMRKD